MSAEPITDRIEILRGMAFEGKLLSMSKYDFAVCPFNRHYSLEVLHQMEAEGLITSKPAAVLNDVAEGLEQTLQKLTGVGKLPNDPRAELSRVTEWRRL